MAESDTVRGEGKGLRERKEGERTDRRRERKATRREPRWETGHGTLASSSGALQGLCLGQE